MKRIASILTAAAVGFLAGWLARGYHLPGAGQVVETRIDTVYYERPQCVASTSRPITVNVPRIVFAPAVVAENATTTYSDECANNAQCSGSCSEIPNNSADSVQMQVEATPATNQDTNQDAAADSVAIELAIESRTYEDSLYRAQVSGPAMGSYRPTLDWIEVYNRTQTITRTETKRNRFAVTAGVGAAYTPAGFQPTVGVQVGVVLWGF